MGGFVRDAHSASIAVRVFDLVRRAKEMVMQGAGEAEIVDVLNEVVRVLSQP